MTSPSEGHPWRTDIWLDVAKKKAHPGPSLSASAGATAWACWGEDEDRSCVIREYHPKDAARDAVAKLDIEEGFVHLAGGTGTGYYTYRYLVAGGKVLGRA